MRLQIFTLAKDTIDTELEHAVISQLDNFVIECCDDSRENGDWSEEVRKSLKGLICQCFYYIEKDRCYSKWLNKSVQLFICKEFPNEHDHSTDNIIGLWEDMSRDIMLCTLKDNEGNDDFAYLRYAQQLLEIFTKNEVDELIKGLGFDYLLKNAKLCGKSYELEFGKKLNSIYEKALELCETSVKTDAQIFFRMVQKTLGSKPALGSNPKSPPVSGSKKKQNEFEGIEDKFRNKFWEIKNPDVSQ